MALAKLVVLTDLDVDCCPAPESGVACSLVEPLSQVAGLQLGHLSTPGADERGGGGARLGPDSPSPSGTWTGRPADARRRRPERAPRTGTAVGLVCQPSPSLSPCGRLSELPPDRSRSAAAANSNSAAVDFDLILTVVCTDGGPFRFAVRLAELA